MVPAIRHEPAASADEVSVRDPAGRTPPAADRTLGTGADAERLGVLYIGDDASVRKILEQLPFVTVEQQDWGTGLAESIRMTDAATGRPRGDLVIVDHPTSNIDAVQVLKAVRQQLPAIPVVVLTTPESSHTAVAALDLGADDAILKTGRLEKRLTLALRRVLQRVGFEQRQERQKVREARLHQLLADTPAGVSVIAADGDLLAMNAEATRMFGVAGPRPARASTAGSSAHEAAVATVLQRAARGGIASLCARLPDGCEFPLSLTAAPVNGGVVASIVESPDAPGNISRVERASWHEERELLEGRIREVEQERLDGLIRLDALSEHMTDRERGLWHAELAALARAREDAVDARVVARTERVRDGSDVTSVTAAVHRTGTWLPKLLGPRCAFLVSPGAEDRIVTSTAADLDALLASLATLGRNSLPDGGTIVLAVSSCVDETSAGAAETLRMSVCGYGVQVPSETGETGDLARRCGCRLAVSSPTRYLLELTVTWASPKAVVPDRAH